MITGAGGKIDLYAEEIKRSENFLSDRMDNEKNYALKKCKTIHSVQ